MRIARLDLNAFGPFTNARLEFEHKPRALQIVYGPNEAGKSSTLRAVIALLYGIPARTTDAHVHEMGKLRIGGVLLDEQGARHEVVRRKGLKHTLLSSKDKPLPDDTLSALLGGLDETLFRQMFGLDHERLRQGAEALLEAGGHLGEGLFDAGTGARTIRTAMQSLAQEADAIFRPRGRTPKLNAAIEILREHHRAQRDAALSPQAFLEQQRGLTEAHAAREACVTKRRGLFEEKARLARGIGLMPLLARHGALTLDAGSPESRGPLDAWDAEHKSLSARFQATRRVEAELPGDRSRAQRLQQEIAELRARVLSAGELQSALDTPTRARIRKFAESHDALLREAQQLARTHSEQTAARALVAEKLLPLERLEPTPGLAQVVERVEREALEHNLLSLDMELAQAERALLQRAKALAVVEDLQALARLQVPDDLELSRLERRASELEQQERARLASERGLGERSAALERARDLLLTQGAPAALEDLERAREQRDQILRSLREAVAARVHTEQDFLAFEASVRLSDEVADRLRKEAHQVAELSRIEAEQRALSRERAVLGEDHTRAGTESSGLHEEARRIAAALGLGSKSPKELRAQVLKLAGLVENAAGFCARAEARHVLARRAEEATEQLERALGEFGGSAALAVPFFARRLSEAMARAKTVLEAQSKHQKEQERLRARWDEAKLLLAATEARSAEVAREVDEATNRFRRELTQLGMSAALSPDEALSSLDELTDLERKTRELASLGAHISHAATDLAALGQDVRAFAVKVEAHSPAELDTEPDTGLLLERLEQVLRKRRDARRDHEERARELAKLDEQIAHGGDGASLEDLRLQVRDLEPDRARARLLEIEDEVEHLDQEIAAFDQTIGSKEAGLSLLEQPSSAVSLAEEMQSDLSSVRNLVRRYLEVRLSQTLLKREVELYRTQHQGPVLSRANQLFPRLTLKRYLGLDVEYDEHDEAVLCAVRQDGKTVRVAGLSDGTRDQLYLALRVASIERFLENNPPLPLILDDAFVHFDDQRAQAALEVLAELCGRTQVLLFTHHHRMVELARSALGREGMILHELDPARGVINLRDDGPLFARL